MSLMGISSILLMSWLLASFVHTFLLRRERNAVGSMSMVWERSGGLVHPT